MCKGLKKSIIHMKSIRREVLTIFYNGGTKEVLSTDGFPYALVKSNRGFGRRGGYFFFCL